MARTRFKRGVCFSAALALAVSYFVYRLWPKGEYMLQYLRPEQVEQWVQVYSSTSLRYHLGFVLGLLGALSLS